MRIKYQSGATPPIFVSPNKQNIQRSIIVTSRKTGIRSITDLKEKSFAFADRTSLTGYILPRMILLEEGIDPEKDFTRVYFMSSQEEVFLNLLEGKIDAGALPVEFASTRWGTVRIGFNLDTFNQGLTKTIQFFLLLTLGVIATVSLIFLFVGDKITQPIEKLIEATQGISQGNFSAKIPVTRKDEVGKLSQAFNRMAETLKEEKEKLEELTETQLFIIKG